MEHSEIMSDRPGSLERYEAATMRAREILIHQHADDEHGSLEVAQIIILSDFSFDTERMLEERIPPDACPVWVHALIWTVGTTVATSLLILVALFATGIAQHLF